MALLDEFRDPATELRIVVTRWRILRPLADQYIAREADWRLLFAYWRRLGLREVARKVKSRWSERERNEKVAAVGAGLIVEPSYRSSVAKGDAVVFFGPNHPVSPSRVVLDDRLVIRAESLPKAQAAVNLPNISAHELEPWFGWSEFSGEQLSGETIADWLARLLEQVEDPSNAPKGGHWPIMDLSVTDRRPRRSEPRGRPTAVLFGLGNYAKTQVLPNIRRHLDLACVHEIDPVQLGFCSRYNVALDTAPFPREDERYDAWFIAGFHHTHAPIALHALSTGGYAVVEKPLATTVEQLTELEDHLRSAESPALFTCFQRRYGPLARWTEEDLSREAGGAVNYHCVVYEIPLPRLHWYRWPNSRSRLTSNGCHWLDHFLFLNDYEQPKKHSMHRARNGDLCVMVELENDAVFSMVLTEVGSERLGVRDYIEVRKGSLTISIVDQTEYRAESTRRILRKGKVHPFRGYAAMYSEICRKILSTQPADSLDSLISTRLTLDLENELS